MEGINNEVLANSFCRSVADSSFPYRDCFSHADENYSEPAGKQKGEEGRWLNIGEEGVVGIVDGIELIVNATVDILNICKGNIVKKEEIRLVSNNDCCWESISRVVDLIECGGSVVASDQ